MRSCPRFVKPSLECLETRETPTASLLDPTFGNAGLVLNPVGAEGYTAALQPDDKILVGGTTPAATSAFGLGAPAVFRFNANGTLDKSFGVNGVASPLKAGVAGSGAVDEVLPQPGGKMIVAGSFSTSSDSFSPFIVRLTAGGQIDPTFGAAGALNLKVNGQTAQWESVFLLNDGTLAVVGVGVSQLDFQATTLVWHFNADGKLNTAFGRGGQVSLSLPNIEWPSFTIQGDGKILASGEDEGSFQWDPHLAL